MKKKYTAQSFSAALALAMLLLTASCQSNIAEPEPELPVNPALPGNASPNGGNEPGVEFTLTTPVISIGATAQSSPAARAGSAAQSRAAAVTSSIDIYTITLYVDLLKADGTVTQSCCYQYTDGNNDQTANGTWAVVTQEGGKPAPLRVNGGNGVYYMRASAYVVTFSTAAENNRYLRMAYTGTATVTGHQTSDGATFTFGKSLSPYTAAVEVCLTAADGNEINSSSGDAATHSNAYEVYLRGMTTTRVFSGAISYEWIDDGTRPVRILADTKYNKIECLSLTGPARYTAVDVLPGSVPGCWNITNTRTDLDAYIPYSQADADAGKYNGFRGDTDGKHLLFSIYQKANPNGADDLATDATGLPNDPTQIKKTYHVAGTTGTDGKIGYTLAPGKLYRFNVSLGSKSASIVSIDVSDFVDAGSGGDINIDNRPLPRP